MLLGSGQRLAPTKPGTTSMVNESQLSTKNCLQDPVVPVSSHPMNSRERLLASPNGYLFQQRKNLECANVGDHKTSSAAPCNPASKSTKRQWALCLCAFLGVTFALVITRFGSSNVKSAPANPYWSDLMETVRTMDARINTLTESVKEARDVSVSPQLFEAEELRESASRLEQAIQRLNEDNERLHSNQHQIQKLNIQETFNRVTSEFQRIDKRINSLSNSVEEIRLQSSIQAQKEQDISLAAYSARVSASDPPPHQEDLSHYKETLENLYRAVYLDGTGKSDWAHAALGGSIAESFTSTPRSMDAWNQFKWFLVPFFPRFYGKALPRSRPADIVIGGPKSVTLGYGSGDRFRPGYCFAFDGHRGNVTIRLPTLIHITEVHIDHAPPQLLPSYQSAPHTFSVYIDDCASIDCLRRTTYSFPPSVNVGLFEFEYPNKTSSTFVLQQHNISRPLVTRRVRFEFEKNFGGDYTCIYRLRVHGSQYPSKQKAPTVPKKLVKNAAS